MNQALPDPFAPFLGMTASVAGLERVEQIRRGAWVHAHTPRPPVGLTPHTEIHRQGKLVVRHYAPAKRNPDALPVVLVPSLINKAWILDLEPGRSLVHALAEAGHPVYLVDWGVPGEEDADQDVGYVLLELLHRSIRRSCRHARADRCVLFGYCMGGTLAAMYTALRPQHVASLVVLNAPFAFAEGGRFRQFTDPAHLDADTAIRRDTLLSVEVLKPAFKMLDPMGNWTKYAGVEAASHDPAKLARVMVRERWLEENVPIAGAFAHEFVTMAYQQDRLLDGTWTVRDEVVDLAAITCPLLVVMSERDFITPPAAAAPVAEAVSSRTVEVQRLQTGHIGVVVGGMGPRTFYPMLDDWCRRTAAGELA